VLKMVEVEVIKLKRAQGWSIRKIARQLGHSRQAVRKALEGPAEPPRYQLKDPRPQPVMGPYLAVVEAILRADEEAPPKQRHTARRIYQRLVEEHGFPGSEATVRRAVRRLRPRAVEMFVPLEAPPGKIAQADFGKAQVLVGGRLREASFFSMRAKASGVPFCVCYPTERLEAFLAGHVAAFEFFGGVFSAVWYDNPKTAVTKILAHHEREEQVDFSRLRAHYLFGSAFCNPAEAHEKGSVENLVGYVRRNALVPHDRPFASFAELNAHLLAWSEKERERRRAAWEEEVLELAPLPERPFRASLSRPVTVSKLSLASVDRNRYSLPVGHGGETLRAELYVDRVEFYAKDALLARHERAYGRGETVLELAHYLAAFERKPRAASACAALHQADPVFLRARDVFLGEPAGYRTFAEILLLGRVFDLKVLATALRKALESGVPSAEMVRQLCLNASHEVPAPLELPERLELRLSAPDLARYDALLAVTR
jgi:transposase